MNGRGVGPELGFHVVGWVWVWVLMYVGKVVSGKRAPTWRTDNRSGC